MPTIGDTVQAIRDGCLFKKGAIGTINNMWSGNSGLYIGIKLHEGRYIGPSPLDYWEVIPTPPEMSRKRKFK